MCKFYPMSLLGHGGFKSKFSWLVPVLAVPPQSFPVRSAMLSIR